MEWARILAYISGTVDRELLLRNEHLFRGKPDPQGAVEGVALRSRTLSEPSSLTLVFGWVARPWPRRRPPPNRQPS
jgi:hypothetical protein